jgi:integrase
VKDFPGLTVEDAWHEISRQEGASRNDVSSRNLKFTALAEHYIEHDLKGDDEPKAHTTIQRSEQIIHGILIPRWGRCSAASVTTLEIMTWLKTVKNDDGSRPANPTLVKIRRVMSLIYKHGQRYGLLPDVNPVKLVKQKGKSGYKPVPVSAEQVKQIVANLGQPERTLTLLVAATGLRISEACGLQWQDVDYKSNLIHVRRSFINGKVGRPKTESSEADVPMHPLLADSLRDWQEKSPWNKAGDWIFASERLKGKIHEERTCSSLITSVLPLL